MSSSSSSSSNGDTDSSIDFKSRFQQSLALQQQNIDDRKSRLKSESTTTDKTSGSMVGSITQSLKGLWGDVLQASKLKDKEAIAKTKKNTGTEYYVDQPGLVASRIESFEKLHMQYGTSIEQLTATMAAGYSRLKSGTLSVIDVKNDVFEVGSTKLYRLQQLVSSDRMDMVMAFIKESGNTCAFCAGIYGDEKTYTRLLDITAVGITSETNPQDIFVALTISLVVGQDTMSDAYGTKKVVVTMKEGDAPLLEKTFIVVPALPPPPPPPPPPVASVSSATTIPVSSSSSTTIPSPSLSLFSPMPTVGVTTSPPLPASSGSIKKITAAVAVAIPPSPLVQRDDDVGRVENDLPAQSSSSSTPMTPPRSSNNSNQMNGSQGAGQGTSAPATPNGSSIMVDGRKLNTRRHRDFVARQSFSDAANGSDVDGVKNGAVSATPGYHGVVLRSVKEAVGLESPMVDATEIYMMEVPTGHEVKMTISPFMTVSKNSNSSEQEIYIKRSGSSNGSAADSFNSRGRADALALHYDATLLAGCYQLDATHRTELEAQQQSSRGSSTSSSSSSSETKVETFVIGSTRTFVRSHLEQKARVNLLASMKANEGRPRMLTSGVYGGRDGRPPIDLTAVAIYSSQAELFISLAIHPTPGNETNPDVLGIRRVVVFTGDGGMPILERIFNVVAKEGTEGTYVRPVTSYADDDDLEEHDSPGQERVKP